MEEPLTSLEIAFDASGAAEAGARGRVVAIVDVIDSATSAEAALAAGSLDVLGAAPAAARPPVRVQPGAVGTKAARLALNRNTDVVVVAEPRIGSEAHRHMSVAPVIAAIEAAGVNYEVIPNQGAELPAFAALAGRVVVIVSATGGTAFDAALAAGSPAACFATTARIVGMTGWEVTRLGVVRAMALAREHGGKLSLVAASANSADDCLAVFEVARAVIDQGFLRY